MFAVFETKQKDAKSLEQVNADVTARQADAEALQQAVDMAMDNAGKVDKTKLLIETIQGLTIKEVDVSRKDRLATGTANDKRVENGIERNADGIIVTLKYEYNGKEYSLKQTVDKLPKGYNPEAKLEERTVEITQDENAEAYFD